MNNEEDLNLVKRFKYDPEEPQESIIDSDPVLQKEEIDHPEHYNNHPANIECIDVVEHLPFNIGNAVKYLWRCDDKHETAEKDLKKALWYIKREITRRGYTLYM